MTKILLSFGILLIIFVVLFKCNDDELLEDEHDNKGYSDENVSESLEEHTAETPQTISDRGSTQSSFNEVTQTSTQLSTDDTQTSIEEVDNNMTKISSSDKNYLQSIQSSFSECNSMLLIAAQIYANFFEDQFSLTIIDPTDESAANAFKCAGGNLFRPISIFDDILQIDLGDETDTSSVSSHPLTNGMFVKSGHDDALGILKIISSHNPRSKVLIHILDGDIEDAKIILKGAFDDLRMLNLAIVMFTEEDDGRYLVDLILYNPFCGDRETRAPQFLLLDFQPENSEENFNKMRHFTDQRITNLHQYPLRVNVFDFPMVSKAEHDDDNKITHYSYVDGETVQIIGEKMNFTLEYAESSDGVQYGYQSEDGNFTGSLGLIENEQVDLLGNPRLIANYNTTKSLFLQPITMMRLSFIIKRRLTFKLLALFYYSQYDKISSAIGTFFTVTFPFIYAYINRWERNIVNKHVKSTRRIKKCSLIRSLLYIFAIQNNVSMQHSNGKATRIIIGVILFYTLVVSSLYQSSITKNLNTNQVSFKKAS